MEQNVSQSHQRTIIHIDIDCFYAQVELLKRPHLQSEPVGVKQKNIVVTCNYVARRFGVKKCMQIVDALERCPNLLLFNGEDLYKYRQASNQIHSFLLTFTNKVEKSGFDENYLDVTELVRDRESKNECEGDIVGHCIGDINEVCICGCHVRLTVGSQIAYEIRTKLKNDLGFTSCCGISYNKLLAKISGCAHKPNQQTTLLPNGSLHYLATLHGVNEIPGIGDKMKQVLESVNIWTVRDLQKVDLKTLKKVVKNDETATNLKNLSLGICDSMVKQSGKPNSIGLEDGFRKISVESEVKEKFRTLLKRLMTLVEEDGRVPMTVKVTVRKHHSERKMGSKETKQSPVPACLFGCAPGKLTEDSTNKLLNIIMGLFGKIVNKKPFHVTLLGLAFSKFHEKVSNRSIASFLLKKRDLSVQSLTSFTSDDASLELSSLNITTSSKSESESEAEPSPKKAKLDVRIRKRKLSEDDVDISSPSKLKVENLNLNGDLDFPNELPASVDPNVFTELSTDLQQEIIGEWKLTYAKRKPKCSKQSLIHSYCLPKSKI